MIFSIRDEGKHYTTKKDVEHLASKMSSKVEEIEGLDFTNNTFNIEALKVIAEVITKMKNLKLIVFDSLFTTLISEELQEELEILSLALKGKEITSIDISNNALGCEFSEKFRDLIESLSTLKFLKMRNCGLGSQGGDRIGECLLKSKSKGVIEILDIAQNMLASISDELSSAISNLENLSILKLEHNSIEKISMTKFLQKMQNNALQELDITDNILNVEGCKALGNIFATWDAKKILMGDCLAKSKGMSEFIKAANKKNLRLNLPGQLEENDEIVLDISYNDWDQSCVHEISEFCKKYSITKINITGNLYDDAKELYSVCKSYGGIVENDEEDASNSTTEKNEEDEVVELISKL